MILERSRGSSAGKSASVNRFWFLFGLLFVLIAFEGTLALVVLASFQRSVAALRTMQNAGMRIDGFGLQLNNFVKEMKISTGLSQQGSSLAPLPPTTALGEGAQSLAEVNVLIRSAPLTRLLEDVRKLRAAVDIYGVKLRQNDRDEAVMTYIQNIEPLADQLTIIDFPSTRAAILADVARVSEANRRAGDQARRMLIASLLATLVVGLVLGRLTRDALRREARQERELQRRASELLIARSIQTSVLPRNLALKGFNVGAMMLTADEVGGDFYEFRPMRDGGAWLAMGDVTGHGLQAGIIMLMVQSMFAVLSEDEQQEVSPRRLFERLNRSMFRNLRDRLGDDRFMTMVVARILPDGRLVYAGAHTDLLIYRAASAAVERVPTRGMWLGLVEDVGEMTEDLETKLEPGDIALFHTDGVTEARDDHGQMFDMELLTKELLRWSGGTAAEVVSGIGARTRSWASATLDDFSLLAIQRR